MIMTDSDSAHHLTHRVTVEGGSGATVLGAGGSGGGLRAVD